MDSPSEQPVAPPIPAPPAQEREVVEQMQRTFERIQGSEHLEKLRKEEQ